MIGNIILWIRLTWKQQTCIHTYKPVVRKDTGGSFDMCTKCEYIDE